MAKQEITGYELSRNWFDWCFENPDLISPTHTAMYFFIIEHCNRLGWKEKFGLPMEMTKDAIGIKNYKTYSKVLNDLINWGFITLIQKSKNQYSSCIIAISKSTKASTKALDKALSKHNQKQRQSTVCIDKQDIETIEPINKEQDNANKLAIRSKEFEKSLIPFLGTYTKEMLREFCNYWTEPNKSKTKMLFEMKPTWDTSRRLATWAKRDNGFKPKQNEQPKTTYKPIRFNELG